MYRQNGRGNRKFNPKALAAVLFCVLIWFSLTEAVPAAQLWRNGEEVVGRITSTHRPAMGRRRNNRRTATVQFQCVRTGRTLAGTIRYPSTSSVTSIPIRIVYDPTGGTRKIMQAPVASPTAYAVMQIMWLGACIGLFYYGIRKERATTGVTSGMSEIDSAAEQLRRYEEDMRRQQPQQASQQFPQQQSPFPQQQASQPFPQQSPFPQPLQQQQPPQQSPFPQQTQQPFQQQSLPEQSQQSQDPFERTPRPF